VEVFTNGAKTDRYNMVDTSSLCQTTVHDYNEIINAEIIKSWCQKHG